MNKTVNINLGGMFFHIDEDAYLKLTRYFDAIKDRSLNHPDRTKSLKISRCCGTVNGKSKNRQTSCRFKRGRPIAVMGQPEDYIIEEDNHDTHSYSGAAKKKKIIPRY
jgi:hypothetical protein